MMGLAISLGLDGAPVVIGDTTPPLAVTSEGDGTLSITNVSGTGGTLTVSVSRNGAPLGDFAVTVSDLASGPVCLVAPTISGTASVGQTLTGTPSLWIYDDALGAPTITRAWRRGAANISGATADTYVVQSADQGASITLRDTATQTAGARSADSNAIAIPAAPSLSVARVGSAYLGSTTGSTTPDFTGADLSGLQVGDELVAVVVSSRFASALSLTGSGALTKLSTDVTPQGYGCVSVFRKTVASGDIGTGKTFVATLDQTASAHALVLYRIRGGTVSAVAIAVRGGVSTTLTATPSGATAAALIAVWGGITTTTSEPTFGGATKNGASEAPTTNRLVSSAVNTSPASNTVTAATSAAFVAGLAVIAVSAT